MKRFWFGLMLLPGLMLMLSACSETSLTPQQSTDIRKVAIISAIGDELNIRSFLPNTGGANGLLDVGPIDELALDQYVIDQATAKLKGKYQVVSVTYQPGTFRQTAQEQAIHAATIQGRALGQVIRANTQLPDGMLAGTDTGPDIYLVLLRDFAKLQRGNQLLSGTSLSQLPATAGVSYDLGVVYWIAVIDGHTLQSIGQLRAIADRYVDASLWAPQVAALTGDQKRQLAAVWKKCIDLTLAPTLTRVPLKLN